MLRCFLFLGAALALTVSAAADDTAAWLDQHRMRQPAVEESGVCAGVLGDLPDFTVVPDAPGVRLVRVSLPFAPGALPADLGVLVQSDEETVEADLRVLTRHPGQPASVRRGMLTFPFRFSDDLPRTFRLKMAATKIPSALQLPPMQEAGFARFAVSAGAFELTPTSVSARLVDGSAWTATLIAPEPDSAHLPVFEVVEEGRHFVWVRLLAPDSRFPRIIEMRVDSLGGVALWAHVQRLESGNDTAGDLGWTLSGLEMEDLPRHGFSDGAPMDVAAQRGARVVRFPRAPHERRGQVAVQDGTLRFLRCEAVEQVAFQETAWRSAAMTIDPAGATARNGLLEYALEVRVAPEAFDVLYDSGVTVAVDEYPIINRLRRFTRRALVQAMAVGDDFGNVTSYAANRLHGAVYGMNRLNHCPPFLYEAWRSGDRALRDTAVLWCENMQALSLWWGPGSALGGTRYNNAAAAGQQEHADDPHFMWRTNSASTFCTKGFDSFFLAYEETGDPRMAVALDAQVAYARNHVHVNTGEARNIGDAADFMALYRYTGLAVYLDEATRLFEELRLCIGEDHLFSQSGKPMVRDVPFIDDDARGYATPFGKPYIMGYALAGLPALLNARPDLDKLPEVVRSVAAFQAESQDPLGGWRYPHPNSTTLLIDQGMEHSAQLARAADALERRGEPTGDLLDALENALRARVLGYLRSGTVLSGLGGWEKAAGVLQDKSIYDLYALPGDRDPSRDYGEGAVSLDYASPEGLAHFFEALQYYLARRPVERLFHANAPLEQVLARMPERGFTLDAQGGLDAAYAHDGTPVLRLSLSDDLRFPGLEPTQSTATAREAVTVATNAQWTMTAAHTAYPALVEWTFTFTPAVPGLAQAGAVELTAVLSEAVRTETIRAHTPAGRLDAGPLPGPEPLLLTASLADTGEVLGFIVPDTLSWTSAEEDALEHAFRVNLPLRGDGPTTLRGFLVMDTDEAALQAFFRQVHSLISPRNAPPPAQVSETATYGMRAMLPAFHEARIARMDFPLAWRNADLPFDAWRVQAREAYLASLQTPPPRAPFAAKTLAVEDRGTHEARKLAFNISADERVTAYLLVPHGGGPFPALLALHDHGAHFTIGKEKVVRPFDVSPERLADAQQWVDQYYGGNFIGDVLASRGYVVFATDALFWGDRGRLEGPQHSAQQELASNILQMGQSWAGIVTWDDLRSAIFLQGLPETDPDRIGSIGLSMGAHRTWNLCAATDIVKAGAAICWMGDTATLLGEGNNQTTGQSAFSMLHPGLRNLLDYPDVASIACPKPMLFYNGTEDGLFPVPGVEAAYAILRGVYEAQGVSDHLETKLWDVPHLFNEAMQEEAFAWLERHFSD